MSNLWRNIEALKEAATLNDGHMSIVMGLDEAHFRQLNEFAFDIPLYAAARLSESFNVDIMSLLAGQIDPEAGALFFLNGPEALPERYRPAQFSRVRSVLNLLRGVEERCGSDYLERLLRRTQVPRASLHDADASINVHFLNDLTSLLIERGWSREELFSLGQFSFQTHQNSSFGKTMATYGNWKNLFEALVHQHAAAFDRNYDYRLVHCSDDSVVIEGHPREEVMEGLKTTVFDNEYACLTRMGVMSTIPCYIGLTPAIVRKTKSVARGDEFNRYEIHPSPGVTTLLS